MVQGIQRYWRLIIFTAATFIVFWLIYLLRSPLFPFLIGAVLAYIFLPVISWAERLLPHRYKYQALKRVLLILLIFIVGLGLLAFLIFIIGTNVAHGFTIFLHNAPQYTTGALLQLQEWLKIVQADLPPDVQREIDGLVANLGVTVGNAVQGTFIRGVSLLPTTIGLVFGLAALPLFLFYVLKDWTKLSNSFYAGLPPSMVSYARGIIRIIGDVMGRYIRAQLLLGVIVGVMALVGLLILRVDFAIVLATIAGITEIIPTLGPWIGGTTAVILTLAVTPDKAVFVGGLFVLIQLLENNLIAPRVQSAYMRIHPAFTIMLLALGAYLAGFWGLVLAVPLTATTIEIYKFISNTAKTESKNHKNIDSLDSSPQ